MSKDDEKSNKGNEKEKKDPFDELNKLKKPNSEEKITIETELDEIDKLDFEDLDLNNIPEYDSKTKTLIENDSKDDESVDLSESPVVIKPDVPVLNVIEEADVNNTKKSKLSSIISAEDDSQENTKKSQKESVKTKETKTVDKLTKDKHKSLKQDKPTLTKVEPNNSEKTDSKTKKIDDVKVDEDGVPLLNQFDSEKIKNTKIFHKLSLSKRNIKQISLIIIGIIITLFGILQASNDVVRISDHVIYGEHESFAIAIIFFGIIIIILAFYKEILSFLGINNANIMEEDNSSSMPKPKHENNKKKD